MAFRPATAIGSGTGGSGKPKTSSYGVQGSAQGATPAKTYTAPVGSKSEQQARYEETVQTIQSAQGGSSKEAAVQARALEAQNKYATGAENKAVIDMARQERNQTVMALSGDPRTEVLQTVKSTKSYVQTPTGVTKSLDQMAFQQTPSFGGGTGAPLKTDFVRQDIQVRAQEAKQQPFVKSADKFIFTTGNKFQEQQASPKGSAYPSRNIVTGQAEDLKAGKPYSSLSLGSKLDVRAEELQKQGGYIGKGVSRETAGNIVSLGAGIARITPKEVKENVVTGAYVATLATGAVASGAVSAPVVAGVGTAVTILGAGAIGVQYLTGDTKGAGKSLGEFALFGVGAKGAGKVIQTGAKLPELLGSKLKTSVTGFQDTGVGVTSGRLYGMTVKGVTTTTSAGKITESNIKIGSDKVLDITTQRVKVPSADAKKGIPEYLTISKVVATKAGKPVGEKIVIGDKPADIYAKSRVTTREPIGDKNIFTPSSKLTIRTETPPVKTITQTKVQVTGSKSKVITTNPDALFYKGTVTNIEGTQSIKTEQVSILPKQYKFAQYSPSREQQLPKAKSILPTVVQEFKKTVLEYSTLKINSMFNVRMADKVPVKSTTRYADATVTQRTTTSVNTLELQALTTPLLIQGGLGIGVNVGSSIGLRTGRLKLAEPKIKTTGETKLRPTSENPTLRTYPQMGVITRGLKLFEPHTAKLGMGFSPSVFTGRDSSTPQREQPAELTITGLQRPKVSQEPKITTEPKLKIEQTPTIKQEQQFRLDYPPSSPPSLTSSFTAPPSTPSAPEMNMPPVIFPPFVTTPSGGLGSGKKFSFSSGKQKTKYTPSAFAVAFNIRGKESKGLSSTGLSLRPIKDKK